MLMRQTQSSLSHRARGSFDQQKPQNESRADKNLAGHSSLRVLLLMIRQAVLKLARILTLLLRSMLLSSLLLLILQLNLLVMLLFLLGLIFGVAHTWSSFYL